MDDDEIIARGGTQEDIDKYAHDNGACGLAYDGTCSDCSPLNTKSQTDNTDIRISKPLTLKNDTKLELDNTELDDEIEALKVDAILSRNKPLTRLAVYKWLDKHDISIHSDEVVKLDNLIQAIFNRQLKQQDIKSRIDENNLLIGADSISGGDGSDFDPTEYASNRIAKLRSKA